MLRLQYRHFTYPEVPLKRKSGGPARPDHWKGHEQARLDGLARGRLLAAKAISKAAAEAYADLQPIVAQLRAEGQTLQAIADRLNAQGQTTRRGRSWNPVQVSRVLVCAG